MKTIIYTIKKGDTLSKIGNSLGIDWKLIWNDNRDIITNPNLIYPGQKIKIKLNKNIKESKSNIGIYVTGTLLLSLFIIKGLK